MKIILIGFMGAGKSAVAEALGGVLSWPVIEMDNLICEQNDCATINAVFAKGGELLLRESEIAIAKSLRHQENIIVSTGGGVVMNKIILDYLIEKKAKIVFLNVSFETILQRLQHDASRPLWQDKSKAKALYDFRLPLYFYYADKVIDVNNMSVSEIVKRIISCGLS